MARLISFALVTLFAGYAAQAQTAAPAEPDRATPDARTESAEDYRQAGVALLADRLARKPRTARAKNLIVFIGDGMGVSTLTAGRIRAGERAGADGESFVTNSDSLPYGALVKTYSTDYQVADSAATATAILSGTKTRSGVLGMGPGVVTGDCAASRGSDVASLFERAEDAGKATGLISTARITHATPAAAYAHSPSRNWENDAALPDAAKAAGCTDIAAQLVAWPHGDGLEVAMGGGRANFLPEGTADPEYPDKKGARKDGRDLTAEWVRTRGGRYVWDRAGLDAATKSDAPLLALFEPSHMQYEADRAEDGAGEPSIAEMTRAAIARLSADTDGYVLLVEGGRIDHAHHAGNAYRALEDFIAFDAAIGAALELVDLDETLVVVTADHGHVFTIAGYPPRGNPILGTVDAGEDGAPDTKDGKAYTTLGYANGPGAVAGERPDPAGVDTTAKDYRQQALVPTGSETHAGEDVALLADGPFAHLFSGVIEQNVIYHVLAHALGLDGK